MRVARGDFGVTRRKGDPFFKRLFLMVGGMFTKAPAWTVGKTPFGFRWVTKAIWYVIYFAKLALMAFLALAWGMELLLLRWPVRAVKAVTR